MLQCSMATSVLFVRLTGCQNQEIVMPRGAYTAKQDRKAEHIEKGYEKRGVSKKEAESRAWATVNKQDRAARMRATAARPAAAPPRRKAGKPAAATARAEL